MKNNYTAPALQNIGALGELTRNTFSKGNDVGRGKSGGMDNPTPLS